MPYPTCTHVKEDGAYCGSPALHDQKYCYYHLEQRGRRLRRARALRDNQPYRLEIQSLDNLYAVRTALTEVFQALAAQQLEERTAGKMLYAIQQVTAVNRRIEQQEAAAAEAAKDAVPQVRTPLPGANLGSPHTASRVQEFPGFAQQFGLPPGADIDAETATLLRQADEEAKYREALPMPLPPPGLRPGSPAYRIYREEAYQIMQLELKRLRHDLHDYHEQKRRKLEETMKGEMKGEMIKKEVQSAATQPTNTTKSA
ncbi:MAG TPA: hypothetical protein VE779_04320 [Candidatus Angelobacter sp.]|jgi:hypothetical protein|nr:hypothetical protein [Candidatus Angelobacter sp.]